MHRRQTIDRLLGAFRWTGGHADFVDVLRDPELVSVKRPEPRPSTRQRIRGHDGVMPTNQDDEDDGLLAEQMAFYREDAVPSDRWLSTLVDDRNDDADARTYRSGRRLIGDHLSTMAPLGRVLEIAAGTGRLAELYVPFAQSAVLVDSSPTSLALAADRLQPLAAVDLSLVEADIFDWDAGARTFDTIVFSAWLHHVPPVRFDGFWRIVGDLLAPRGTVVFDFLDDGVPSPGGTELPVAPADDYAFYAPVDGVSTRDLHGRRWRVVHDRWQPDQLIRRLREAGWEVSLLGPGLLTDLVWATARR